MEKIKLIVITLLTLLVITFSILYLISYYSEYKYQFKRQQKIQAFNEQISRSPKSPYEIVEQSGGGHVDGSETVGIWPFVRHHSVALYIYQGKLKVTHDNQTALINIQYYFDDDEENIRRKKQQEGIDIDSYDLVIGLREVREYQENGQTKTEVVKGTGKNELDKLQAIGLSKEEFENNLKKHFTKIYYH